MSDKNINVLESITPVEMLMSADVKDVNEKEWEAALNACVADLLSLSTQSSVPLVRHMQQVIKAQLTSRHRAPVADAALTRSVLADCFSRVLRCYVARARKAAKPFDLGLRRHEGGKISWLVYDDLLPTITEKYLQQLREALASTSKWPLSVDEALPRPDSPAWAYFTKEDIAGFFAPGGFASLQKAQAQQPVIPENGYCWAKDADGVWRLVYCSKGIVTWFFYRTVHKHDGKWLQKTCYADGRAVWCHHPVNSLRESLEAAETKYGQSFPKPVDENTPWIVLTADGKLELEKVPVVEFKTRSYHQEEAPLKPWKERPEDLYWFRVNAGFSLRDRKYPTWFKFPTSGTNDRRETVEKEHGLPKLPVVRTSGYWLFGEDDRLRITVDGKEYMANGPNQARFIEKEKGWPSLPVRFVADAYVDKRIAHDDAKDAEGWEWLQLPGDSLDLAHKGIFRGAVRLNPCVRKGPAWMASLSEMSRAVLCFLPFQESKEDAMLALEKHYNLPRLNRP